MIRIFYSNANVPSSSVELKHVRNIEWRSIADSELYVSKKRRVAHREREIVVNGFIRNAIFNNNVSAQFQLETDLRNVGVGTLNYASQTIQNVRFISLVFTEFRGNPISEFTIRFRTDDENIHAHSPVMIGTLELSTDNGFELPSVKETLAAQGTDETISETKRRSFVITGKFVGNSLQKINNAQTRLVDAIKDQTTVTLLLTAASVGNYEGAFTVRPRKLDFSAPEFKGDLVSRQYTFECDTYDDYSKEPYTLGETATTFSTITLDVVNSVDHNLEYDRSSSAPQFSPTSEEISVNGKKYFSNYATYTAFRDLFRPIPAGTYTITSSTGVTLLLVDVSVGKFERDGNTTANAKRYSASVSLTFRWVKTLQETYYEVGTVHFNVLWYTIQSISFNASNDQRGKLNHRSITVNGEVLGIGSVNTLYSLVGTLTGGYDLNYANLVVSSVNVSGARSAMINGAATTLYKVSITAAQLDSAAQAINYLTGLLKMDKLGAAGLPYSTDQMLFENITNRTKSISNRWNQQLLKHTVTQINFSVSGEVWDTDASGQPASPNKVIDIFNKIDALLTAEISTQSGPNTYVGNELLPTNADIHYILNSFSVGEWQPFLKQTGSGSGNLQVRLWKQTVSVSATAVFDLTTTTTNEPDSVEVKAISYEKESPKYQQLQVLGLGTVFKRIGTTPEKLAVSYEKRWKDERTYALATQPSLGGNPEDFGADDINPPVGWGGLPIGTNSFISRDVKEKRNQVHKHTVEYTASTRIGP